MTKEDIETAVGITGKSIGVIGAVGAVVVAIVPRARRAFSAYCAANDLAKTFGRDAGTVLKKLLVSESQKLSQTAAIAEAMTRAIHLGVYVCDSNGRNISSNAVLERWIGMSREKLVGYGWLDGIVDREKAFAHWRFAVENGIPYRDTYEIRNVDTGDTFKAATEAVSVNVDGGSIFVGFVRKLE